MDQVRDLALEHRPKMIVAGTTSYPRRLDPEPFKAIADEVGALFLFDAAHIAGLIAGGAHPNPVPYADVVTFTTHKTLRGPRGGCILSTAEHAAAIDKAVFPGWQGGPLEHVIAGKAVAFFEAAQPSFTEYAQQIVAQRERARRGARRRGLPPRQRRHRQPPDGRRPAAVRRRLHRQGGAGGARPSRHHAQQEHDPRRPAQPVRHERRAHRHPVGHHAGDARGGDGDDRRADRPGAARPQPTSGALAGGPRATSASLCARFPVYALTGRTIAPVPSSGAYLIVGGGRSADHLPRRPRSSIGLARRVGWVYEPNERTVHTTPDARRRRHRDVRRLRRCARDRAADGRLRPAVRAQLRAARRADRRGRDVRGRAARRRPRHLGAGQGGRHRRSSARRSSTTASRCSTSACRSSTCWC